MHIGKSADKADFIHSNKALFIDDSNAERVNIKIELNIPVFSPDMIDVLNKYVMIELCDNRNENVVINYIGKDYPKCLYLYLDIIKFGCQSDTTQTWIQSRNNEITSVVLAYHTAIHIFSRDNEFDILELADLLMKINPTIINARLETIKKIEPILKGKGFLSEFGHIGEWMEDDTSWTQDKDIDLANENDIPQIADLLYEDEDIGASYVYEDLLHQIKERLDEGFTRSYVIRKGDKVIAHVGTGAETDKVCTIAYTITAQDFRGQGLAKKLYNHACGILRKEGKRVFSVYYPENAYKFHHKVGFSDICKFGKLFKNVQ